MTDKSPTISECLKWLEGTARYACELQDCLMLETILSWIRDHADYKCVKGHDLCHTMMPCKECPYCEIKP